MAKNSMLSIASIGEGPEPKLPPQKQKLEDKNLASQLTEQQLHVWEHAALLYHGYEWQAAADTFAVLSKDIQCPQLRSFCLLNTASILARMGDYDVAASIIDTAAHVDATSVIAVFLMAIMAYQLEDYCKAAYCFEICLEGFGPDEAIDYSDFGLQFALDLETVRSNLREAHAVHLRRGVAPNSIYNIPAELIFEAPTRFTAKANSAHVNRQRPSTLPKLHGVVRPTSISVGSSKSNEDEKVSSMTTRLVPLCRQDAPRSAPNHPLAPVSNENYKFRIPPRTEIEPQKPWHKSWRGRPRTPYTPRDARAASDSTNELARFIRKGGQVKNMIPRDPRGEYESVQELSIFAEAFAPDTLRSKTPEPFDLDPYFIAMAHLAALLSERYDTERRLGLKKDSLISDLPIVSQSSEQPSCSDNSGASLTTTSRDQTGGEILLPTVYQPPSKTIHGWRNCLYQESNAAEHSVAQNKDQVSPKSDSSSEKRKKRHRALVLQALEGNNTFPPYGRPITIDNEGSRSRASWLSKPSSSVDTEHFFDAVLRQRKRS